MRWATKWGADTVMDFEHRKGKKTFTPTREVGLSATGPVPIGTVPIYQGARENWSVARRETDLGNLSRHVN